MTATYEDIEGQKVGTLRCDACGATYTDRKPETPGSSLRMRAGTKGWSLHRPHEYRADDRCPNCSAS